MPETKLAVIAGINHYRDSRIQDLSGCVNDAKAISQCLERDLDCYNSPNFDCLTVTSERNWVDQYFLLLKLYKLFNTPRIGTALFYFSGHGHWNREESELYLATSDARWAALNYGLPFSKVLSLAQHSPADHIVIMLDCCHAGGAGEIKTFKSEFAKASFQLRQDMTIIASSRRKEPSAESNGMSHFTRHVVEALNGDHEDPLGFVTIGGIYRMVQRQFSTWSQCPVLMTNQSSTVILRRNKPLIEPTELREKLFDSFESEESTVLLDPEYDIECLKDLPKKERNQYKNRPEKLQAMRVFRELNTLGMLRPKNEVYLYYAALRSDSLALTPKGKAYHRMAQLNMF